ncbi:MAG: RNA polymerase sigma factor [Candidatus Competibacterales bacterium]|nr:RNA polymerase sigma factor [Candidatus Competibacterales bacterium]
MTDAARCPAATTERTRALDRFLAGVERRALRLAEIAVGDREEALDIVQDAMCRLSRRYGDRDPQEWGALFQRILQNRIRDAYRRRAVRNRLRIWLGEEAPDPGELPDRHGRTPEQQLQGEQALARLEQALRRLPLRQQQAFLLRAWEGLDVAQTARALGCSAGSVKTHYFRAVQRLRGLLEDLRP